jgi:predicted RNase H-like HicB family nuclease
MKGLPPCRIEVAWSAADQLWIADIPDLEFCSAHGVTPHEAVAEVEQAAQAWLEAARAIGPTRPTPSTSALQA